MMKTSYITMIACALFLGNAQGAEYIIEKGSLEDKASVPHDKKEVVEYPISGVLPDPTRVPGPGLKRIYDYKPNADKKNLR